VKILYLITKSNFGGAQRYVFDLAVEAKKRGHDVVVGFGGEGQLKTRLDAAEVRTLAIPTLERDVNLLADTKSFFALLDVFSDELPDVVHLNSSKMGALGALAARVSNTWAWITKLSGYGGKPMRIIFTGHGWAFNEERSDAERFAIAIVHWVTIQLAHKVIAVSRRTRDQVASLPLSWHKLVTIHNGVGEMAFLPKEEALQRVFGGGYAPATAERPLIIGTLAELHNNKGLSYAIEGVAAHIKQTNTPTALRYVILGEGEERGRLEALRDALGLKGTVHLAGYRENAAELLPAFDIFLFPSITEAFPYAILEAGKAGLPIIASAVGGIPEVIDDMQSGILIQPKNPSEIARAVSYLLEHPDKRTAFGEEVRRRIEGRFNVAKMADETFVQYER
jgi:glycosyltransferase involved in cell wall biosynthesis